MLRGLPNVILTPHIGGSTEEAQADIGAFVGGKLADFIAEGTTSLSVNLPQVALPPATGTHRLAHLHRNVPGVMAEINSVLAEHKVNVEAQLLGTRGELGYALTDIGIDYPDAVVARLAGDGPDGAAAGSVLTLEAALRAAVGSEHVLLDADLRASYETDWTGRFTGASRAVVRPADDGAGRAGAGGVQRSAASRSSCRAATPAWSAAAFPPRAGGRLPVMLAHHAPHRARPGVAGSRQVTAGAGVTLAALTAHARAAGLDFGVDLAARDSATVGGMVATNAGGIRVMRLWEHARAGRRGRGRADRRPRHLPAGRPRQGQHWI